MEPVKQNVSAECIGRMYQRVKLVTRLIATAPTHLFNARVAVSMWVASALLLSAQPDFNSLKELKYRNIGAFRGARAR